MVPFSRSKRKFRFRLTLRVGGLPEWKILYRTAIRPTKGDRNVIRIRFMALLPMVLATQIVAQINVPASVLTQRNDVQGSGVYRDETVLTPSVVSGAGATRFTRLVIRKVDGQVAAQPLYVRGITISGVKKNVLYVVTRKNMIYAFDADNVNQNDPHQGMVWAILIHFRTGTPQVHSNLRFSHLPWRGWMMVQIIVWKLTAPLVSQAHR